MRGKSGRIAARRGVRHRRPVGVRGRCAGGRGAPRRPSASTTHRRLAAGPLHAADAVAAAGARDGGGARLRRARRAGRRGCARTASSSTARGSPGAPPRRPRRPRRRGAEAVVGQARRAGCAVVGGDAARAGRGPGDAPVSAASACVSTPVPRRAVAQRGVERAGRATPRPRRRPARAARRRAIRGLAARRSRGRCARPPRRRTGSGGRRGRVDPLRPLLERREGHGARARGRRRRRSGRCR